MFLDDGYNPCKDSSNVFPQISNTQKFVNAQSATSFGGQVMTITSLLFYRNDWLKWYYHQPTASNKSLVKRLRSQLPVPF